MSRKTQVSLADGAQLDAFSRLRVSTPQTLFDSQHEYQLNLDYWETAVVGGGTATFSANGAKVTLSNGGGTDTHSAMLQSREYHRYQPGKSQFGIMTFVFGTAVGNCRKEAQYGDERNGVGIVQDGTNGLKLRIRSYVSGAAVDTYIPQANWNRDKLDGTGPSGKTIDVTKIQIWFLDLEWLGAGRVRCGFDIDGEKIVVHEQFHANRISTVYMTTANLPFRFYLLNDGTSAAASMDAVCTSVVSEGGFELGRLRPYTSTRLNASVGPSVVPLIALRLQATVAGVPNHAVAFATSVDIMQTTTGSIYWSIYAGYNLTVSGGSWVNVGSLSLCQANITATSLANGHVIKRGFIIGTAQAKAPTTTGVSERFTLTNSIDHTTPTNVVLAATSTSGTQSVYATLGWDELG